MTPWPVTQQKSFAPQCDKSISCGRNCADKECDSKVKSELQLLGLKIMTFSVMAPGGPDRGSNRGPPQCKSRTLLLIRSDPRGLILQPNVPSLYVLQVLTATELDIKSYRAESRVR